MSAVSDRSFDDAVKQAYSEVSKTVRGVQSVYVNDFIYEPGEEEAGSYRVHCKVTFVVQSGSDASQN